MTSKKWQGKTVGVIYGGFSRERDVSLRSGKNVADALDRLGYTVRLIDPAHDDIRSSGIDVAFNVLHGQYGEDGSIQAFLELLNIPFTGPGVSSSVLSINKVLTKQLLETHNYPTPKWVTVRSADLTDDFPLRFPVIVKPFGEGSSVGMQIIDRPEDFSAVMTPLIDRFYCILVEELIEGTEITISVIDKDGAPLALPILELRPKNRFYDFEAKYTSGMTEFLIPSSLSEEVEERCKKLAVQIYQLLGCKGMSRVDMMVENGQDPYVLELNSIPGMTALSDLPASAAAMDISFDELVEIILDSAA